MSDLSILHDLLNSNSLDVNFDVNCDMFLGFEDVV